MMRIEIARHGRKAVSAALLDSMHRLRCDVFHRRLNWAVQVEDGRERDRFDGIDPYYVIAHPALEPTRAVGCCRLLPTLGPNMLRDVFAALVDAAPMPSDPRVWEISRFAVADDHTDGGYGFSAVPTAMLQAVVRFAARRQLRALVGVTSAPVERMLRRLGFRVERLGAPRRIGTVMSLAFRLPIDAAIERAVCGRQRHHGLPRAA
jgi:acyl homoserine lactone synthase